MMHKLHCANGHSRAALQYGERMRGMYTVRVHLAEWWGSRRLSYQLFGAHLNNPQDSRSRPWDLRRASLFDLGFARLAAQWIVVRWMPLVGDRNENTRIILRQFRNPRNSRLMNYKSTRRTVDNEPVETVRRTIYVEQSFDEHIRLLVANPISDCLVVRLIVLEQPRWSSFNKVTSSRVA